MITTKRYLWATTGETMPEAYIDTGLKTYPLFCCVMREPFARKLDLSDIPTKQVVDEDGTIRTIVDESALMDNERLAKIANGAFADAFVDRPDTTPDFILGAIIGGFYTVLFTRREWFQDKIVSTIAFAVMFALIIFVSRRQ